jgi:hypothetical protein
MKLRHISAFLALAISTSAQTQTGRDYFNELKATNSTTKALDHYSDEYVCFDDDNGPAFAVIAKAATVIEHMRNNGDTAGAKLLAQVKDGLFVTTYYKGAPNGEAAMYEAVGKEGTDYRILFNAPFHGKTVYSINWATGRFRFQVFALDHNKTVPAAEKAGKCELIHPPPVNAGRF